jgi:cell division protein FtsQ
MPTKARFPRTEARAEAATPPWRSSLPRLHPRAWLVGLAPTRRSLAIGLGVLAFALGAYLLARETSLFAISRIEVQGGSPRVDRQVRQALSSLAGRPLVGLDGSTVLHRVDALPTVVSSSYDRAFPHTLRINVVPELPAAVVRRGSGAWLVSARGRVMERLQPQADPRLPRIWVSAHTGVQEGAELTAAEAGAAAHAVAFAGAFAARVATASYVNGVLVFHLRSGLELVLGSGGDVKLKVAVAGRALAALPSGSTFLDVSVPSRPVSGTGTPSLIALQGSSRG